MTTFELTEDHIKLLRSMIVGWQDCEFGAPEIDPKRPYGNSDVVDDIRVLLAGTGKGPSEKLSTDYCEMLHAETATALQIVLVTGQFKSGLYSKVCEYDTTSWVYEGPYA